MTRSKWKPLYVNDKLINSILANKNSNIIRTTSRSSTILKSFVGLIFEVYTGKSYTKIYIEEKMVGHKLGEFSLTRKIGKIHEKKIRKGKSNKK